MNKILSTKLTSKQQASLKAYKFSGIDNSILSKYVLSHYTKWMIEKIPATMAPNTLTLIGLVSMCTSLVMTLRFDPSLDNAPRFLPLMNFLLLFIYLTCDNLDGAQARRTGSGSPLGQLLDHGVDSCCSLISIVGLSSSLGLGFSYAFLVLAMAVMVQFYLAGLEEKLTGHFVLGRISGATEGIVTLLLLHLMSFVLDKKLQYYVSDGFLWPTKTSRFGHDRFMAFMAMISILSCVNLLHTLITLMSKVQAKMRPLLCMTLFRMAILFVSFFLTSNLLKTQSLEMQHLNILVFGQVFSIKYVSEIYSHIVKHESLFFAPPYAVYLQLFVFFQVHAIKPYMDKILEVLFIVSSAYYLLVSVRIIQAMTSALGIRFLSIDKPNRRESKTKVH